MKSPEGTGVLDINGVECRFMTVPDLMQQQRKLKYIDVFGLLQLISTLCFDNVQKVWDPPNLLLNGYKGGGKSLLLATYAQQNEIPYLALDCSEETKERHMKGGFVAKSGSTPYVLGTVANAILIANQVGKAMLVFEEINALSRQRQKDLNPLTDFRKKIEIPELCTRFELNPGAKLFVCGTLNPTVYGGTYEMNDDLVSRFFQIEVPYPTKEDEITILREMAPQGLSVTNDALSRLVDIAHETRQSSTTYSLSTRDLVQILSIIDRVGWEDALFLATQKFSAEDRTLVIDRIRDITRVTLYKDLVARAATRNTTR